MKRSILSPLARSGLLQAYCPNFEDDLKNGAASGLTKHQEKKSDPTPKPAWTRAGLEQLLQASPLPWLSKAHRLHAASEGHLPKGTQESAKGLTISRPCPSVSRGTRSGATSRGLHTEDSEDCWHLVCTEEASALGVGEVKPVLDLRQVAR